VLTALVVARGESSRARGFVLLGAYVVVVLAFLASGDR
jgi:Ca2+/H+ antiporter